MKSQILLACIFTTKVLTAFETDIGVSYRNDSLNWTIREIGRGPNILSELKWNHVKSINLNIDASVRIARNSIIEAGFNIGKIFQGKNCDLDYVKNDRMSMFAESYSDADKGYVLDADIFLKQFANFSYGTIYGSLGFTYDKVHLSMIEGVQNDYVREVYDYELTGLDSRYTASFYGPVLGIGYLLPVSSFWFDLFYNFAFLEYKGKGYWNLRDDIIGNFRHEAEDGFGHSLGLNIEYSFNPIDIGFSFLYRYFKAYNGLDLTTFESEGIIYHSQMKLNEVRLQNYAFGLYLSYEFFKQPSRMGTRDRITRYFGN